MIINFDLKNNLFELKIINNFNIIEEFNNQYF